MEMAFTPDEKLGFIEAHRDVLLPDAPYAAGADAAALAAGLAAAEAEGGAQPRTQVPGPQSMSAWRMSGLPR